MEDKLINRELSTIEKVRKKIAEHTEILHNMPIDVDDSYQIGFIKGLLESLDVLKEAYWRSLYEQ